jgi:trans-2,3-dihydro-3-hydroxyanthranilate isomerase
VRYRIVDVFSARPLAGNALCVVLDPCPPDLMAAVAVEVNLSETTFPVVAGSGRYRMRIFTPGGEIPFAGHPSLGTAWALGPGQWEQTTAGAVVTVVADGRGAVMGQPDPVLTPVAVDGVAPALGLPGVEGAFLAHVGGTRHVLVPTTAPLDSLAPDLAAVAAVSTSLGGVSLCPFRRLSDDLLHVRAFAPAAGIAEDPGTGSAAGPIAVLAHQRWGTAVDVVIQQGAEMGRPCLIEAHGEPGAVRVGGAVSGCAEGSFSIG